MMKNNSTYHSLNQVPVGCTASVRQLNVTGPMRRRLRDIGVIEDTKIKCLQKSPAGDPTAYLIRGAVIALRKEDSADIIVY